MNKKCVTCDKTVYAAEAVVINEHAWHKACFRCKECNTKVTLQNYKITERGSRDIYCHKCVPTHRPTVTADSVDQLRVKNRPKVALVNDQVRGELAGQKSSETTDSVYIGGRINAPKQGVLNEQIRGEFAGQKTSITADAAHIQLATHAPKVSLVNDQVRGELAGVRTAVSSDSVEMQTRMNAPKTGPVNEQVRGEYAGQKTGIDASAVSVVSSAVGQAMASESHAVKGERVYENSQRASEHAASYVTEESVIDKVDAKAKFEKMARSTNNTLTKSERDKYAHLSPQEAFMLRKKEKEGATGGASAQEHRPSVPLPDAGTGVRYATPMRAEQNRGDFPVYQDPNAAALAAQQALELAAAKEAAIAAQRAAAIAKYAATRPEVSGAPPPIPTSARPQMEDMYVSPEDIKDADNLYEDVGSYEQQPKSDDLYMPLY